LGDIVQTESKGIEGAANTLLVIQQVGRTVTENAANSFVIHQLPPESLFGEIVQKEEHYTGHFLCYMGHCCC
jgi:hypothetical protein